MSWLIGVLALLAIAVVLILLIDARGPRTVRPPLWEVTRTSMAQTNLVGGLGALTVASAIFLSSQAASQQNQGFEVVIGLFLLTFIQLVGTAMQFAAVPSHPLDEGDADREQSRNYSHLLASLGYYLGISLALSALIPFSRALSLAAVEHLFVWLVLLVIVAGAARLAMWQLRQTSVRAVSSLLLLPIGVALVAIYAALATVWPALLPTSNAVLAIATVAFFIGATGFMLQTALLAIHGLRPTSSGAQQPALSGRREESTVSARSTGATAASPAPGLALATASVGATSVAIAATEPDPETRLGRPSAFERVDTDPDGSSASHDLADRLVDLGHVAIGTYGDRITLGLCQAAIVSALLLWVVVRG